MTDDAADEPDLADARSAMDLLANEVRLSIVFALGDAAATPQGAGIAFSDLRERAGVRDSGRFNYHLEQLRDQFVSAGDDGYELTPAGSQVYQLLVRGAFEAEVSTRSLSVDADCLRCGGSLAATYRSNGILRVACEDCETSFYNSMVPPALIANHEDDAAALHAARDWIRSQTSLLWRGTCPWCAGVVETALVDPAEVTADDPGPLPAFVRFGCRDCGTGLYATPGGVLLTHPTVLGFAADRGVDLRDRFNWELPFAVTAEHTSVVGTDPLRVAVTVECDGDALRVELDEDAQVMGTERR